jgi:acyl carrier protein
MMNHQEIVRTFVVENFLFGEANGLGEDTSFIGDGIVDSTGVMELIAFLESKFSITIEDEEVVPENLDSLRRLSLFLESKLEKRSDSCAE